MVAAFSVLQCVPVYAAESETITITVRVDGVSPTVDTVYPSSGSIVETATPLIKAEYSDLTGINASDVQLSLNGQNVTSLCTTTSDYISYTPSQDLEDKVHTVEVLLQDTVGNQISSSWDFRVYTGELVGTEGGTVISPDGKITVEIPVDALSEPTRIRVTSANIEAFGEDELPEDQALSVAGDFRPAGQPFNKDIKITFQLDTPEVPGTPIDLSLYNVPQETFIPTGASSQVEADSTTVSFFIEHFSTYGALKGLISQGAPFGSGVKVPVPDMFTGAFGHPIQINLPPGRKGVQPNLTLQYRSSGSNSWVGFGWGLNPGFIVRSTKQAPPTYNDETDTFLFVTDGGSTELVHLTGNLYQAKIESGFAKFFKETDDSWKVVNKGGTVLKLGTTSDSKETSTEGTFAWYLNKFTDNNGNYISLSYIKDGGKPYLSRIDYTGNDIGISPRNSIEFSLEGRDDASSSFISGSKITTAKRLREIQAKCNGELVYRYELEYEYSQDTERSLLKRVKTYTSDNKEFPMQEFTYQRAR